MVSYEQNVVVKRKCYGRHVSTVQVYEASRVWALRKNSRPLKLYSYSRNGRQIADCRKSMKHVLRGCLFDGVHCAALSQSRSGLTRGWTLVTEVPRTTEQ